MKCIPPRKSVPDGCVDPAGGPRRGVKLLSLLFSTGKGKVYTLSGTRLREGEGEGECSEDSIDPNISLEIKLKIFKLN